MRHVLQETHWLPPYLELEGLCVNSAHAQPRHLKTGPITRAEPVPGSGMPTTPRHSGFCPQAEEELGARKTSIHRLSDSPDCGHLGIPSQLALQPSLNHSQAQYRAGGIPFIDFCLANALANMWVQRGPNIYDLYLIFKS